jgi:uncharacterized membrane protein YhaH (DUF805 family)
MEWMLMPYRRYADFSGRSRRQEYWMFTLFVAIVYAAGLGLMFAGGFSFNPDGTGEPGVLFWVGAGLIGLFALGTFIPMIAVVVRRLHDRDMSGWWYLGAIVAGLIPFVGFLASIALLVVMCLEGTRGPNRFGPDPKDPTEANVFA